jgi:hypothetical protein
MTGPQDAYDAPLSALRNGAEDLAVALAIWEARDDTRADANARRAASNAVGAIDAMLRDLYALRQSLISQIRASDAASVERAEQLLARGPGAATSSADQASQRPAGPGETEGRALERPARERNAHG